jgi:hypothetical protein
VTGDSMERMVEVYIAGDVLEAHFLKELLNQHGLEAQVVGENSAYSGLTAIAGPRLWVFERDRERAREILAEYEAGRARADDDKA